MGLVSEHPLPKGVAVYDRPAPSPFSPGLVISGVLALVATGASLYYFL